MISNDWNTLFSLFGLLFVFFIILPILKNLFEIYYEFVDDFFYKLWMKRNKKYDD